MTDEIKVAEELMGMEECPHCHRLIRPMDDHEYDRRCVICNSLLVLCVWCKKKFAENGYVVCGACGPAKEEARDKIVALMEDGKTYYYSGISEKLGIDIEVVIDICQELSEEGLIGLGDEE